VLLVELRGEVELTVDVVVFWDVLDVELVELEAGLEKGLAEGLVELEEVVLVVAVVLMLVALALALALVVLVAFAVAAGGLGGELTLLTLLVVGIGSSSVVFSSSFLASAFSSEGGFSFVCICSDDASTSSAVVVESWSFGSTSVV